MSKTKYEIVLFQPYIRAFVLNLGKNLKHFTFRHITKIATSRGSSANLPPFSQEIKRTKLNWRNRLRRFLGIPNVRIRLNREGDLLMTYGCFLITPMPYCVYIETGLTVFNYDVGIVKNPIARWLVGFLATRSNCKKLIFISQTAKKSFFASTHYSPALRKRLEDKSVVIYPMPITRHGGFKPKKFTGSLKLLFPGQFYIKGGMEIAKAYQRLRKNYPNVSLTIITAVQMLRPKDVKYLQSLPGLTLHDAKLNEQQMIDIYSTHDLFLLPTYREGFGLVLIEALAYGLPVIITDQYATTEMARDGINGFIYPNHPLKDYDPATHAMIGRFYNPADFYAELFRLQKTGQMKPIENFIEQSVEKFLDDPKLLEKFSRNSIALYKERFDIDKISAQLDAVFLKAVKP